MSWRLGVLADLITVGQSAPALALHLALGDLIRDGVPDATYTLDDPDTVVTALGDGLPDLLLVSIVDGSLVLRDSKRQVRSSRTSMATEASTWNESSACSWTTRASPGTA